MPDISHITKQNNKNEQHIQMYEFKSRYFLCVPEYGLKLDIHLVCINDLLTCPGPVKSGQRSILCPLTAGGAF